MRKLLRRTILICLSAALLAGAFACGRQTADKEPSVRIESGEGEITVGETYSLRYTAENAESVQVSISEQNGGNGGSYDESAGTFTASAAGKYTLTVTARAGEKSASASVRVSVTDPDAGKTRVTQAELLARMTGSIFTEPVKADTFSGLSDESAVGVNRDRFENEVLYPVPEDSAFAAVYNVTDYGLSTELANNAGKLKLLLNTVKAQSGLKKLVFPAGRFLFNETVELMDINDLYIVGSGTEWIVTEWTTILNVNRCTNLHINNIDFDYEPSSTVTGKVVAADSSARTVTVEVDPEFDMSDHRFTGGKISRGNYMEYVYDSENECYVPDASGMLRYNSPGDSSYGIEAGVYDEATRQLTVTFNTNQGSFRAPETGKVVSLAYTMYEYAAFMITRCTDYYMESCNLYAALGMAFVTYNDQNVYMNRTNLMLRPGSSRLMTATADGLHANGCYGDMIVTNSIYEASHDDAMNICSFYNSVTSWNGKTLVCAAKSQTTNYPIEQGDVIEIYDPNSLALIDTYTVEEVTAYALTYELTLDRRVRNVELGYLVGNTSRVPNLKVDNCVIRNKRNRGILGQVRDSEITNCAFYNIIHGPVMLNAAIDIFDEAIVPRNIAVRNCKFWNNNYGYGLEADVAAFRYGGTVLPDTVRNIEVTNNFFYNSAAAGVYFCGTGGCSASNNLFYNISRAPRNANQKSAVWLNIDLASTVRDNFTYLTETLEGFSVLRATSSEGYTAENNTGFHV